MARQELSGSAPAFITFKMDRRAKRESMVMKKPNINRNRVAASLSAALVVLLSACGGSTDVAGIQGSGSPAPASATTVGTVAGFGSIFVDGIEYSTAAAQISVDGQVASETQLNTGQVVTINGTVNSDGKTGTATQVTFSGDAVRVMCRPRLYLRSSVARAPCAKRRTVAWKR